jgi:hypothetical protein
MNPSLHRSSESVEVGFREGLSSGDLSRAERSASIRCKSTDRKQCRSDQTPSQTQDKQIITRHSAIRRRRRPFLTRTSAPLAADAAWRSPSAFLRRHPRSDRASSQYASHRCLRQSGMPGAAVLRASNVFSGARQISKREKAVPSVLPERSPGQVWLTPSSRTRSAAPDPGPASCCTRPPKG